MGGPSTGSSGGGSAVFAAFHNEWDAQARSMESVALQSATRSDILSAALDDSTRASLLTQIDSIGAIGTQSRLDRLQPIIDTLSSKKALSDQVAKLYQNAVAQASKNQSTVITSGKPAAVIPSGNSTIITGGGQI